MKRELFDPVSFEGRSAQIAVCTCGNTIANHLQGGRASDEVLARAFGKKGWNIDLKRGRFKCPKCIEAEIAARRLKNEEKKMSANQSVPPTKTMPSEESVFAKQLMMELLSKGYDLKMREYRPGWTDARIAAECSLSVDFIAKRREEDFGPVTPPRPDPMIEIASRLNDLSILAKAIVEDVQRISGAATNLRGGIAKFSESLENMRVFVNDWGARG